MHLANSAVADVISVLHNMMSWWQSHLLSCHDVHQTAHSQQDLAHLAQPCHARVSSVLAVAHLLLASLWPRKGSNGTHGLAAAKALACHHILALQQQNMVSSIELAEYREQLPKAYSGNQ